MQKIEVTGTIDQQGYIQLDHPLNISDFAIANLKTGCCVFPSNKLKT
jgi:hypothetical protein